MQIFETQKIIYIFLTEKFLGPLSLSSITQPQHLRITIPSPINFMSVFHPIIFRTLFHFLNTDAYFISLDITCIILPHDALRVKRVIKKYTLQTSKTYYNLLILVHFSQSFACISNQFEKY